MSTSGLVWRFRIPHRSFLPLAVAAASLAAAVVLLPLRWAGMVVAGSVVLLLAWLRPQIGILMVVFSIPLGSFLSLPVGQMRLGVTEVLVWVSLAGWVMRIVTRRRAYLPFTWIGAALSLLLGVMLASCLVAQSLEPSVGELVKWLEVLGAYVMVSHELDDGWLRALTTSILVTGGLAALQGIYQFSSGVGPDAFLLFGRFMRAHGSFGQPNPYAGYLGLSLAVAVGVLFGGVLVGDRRARLRWLLLAAGTGVLMLTALVMSWSRGAWLGLVAAVAVMGTAALLRLRKRAFLAILVLALLLLSALALIDVTDASSGIAQRVAGWVPFLGLRDVRGAEVTDTSFSVLERMAHWQAALGMWTDHAWLGVGIGNYPVAYPRYSLPTWDDALGHAHNFYLNLGAETGLLGLTSYLAVWGLALAGAWRASRAASGWKVGVALGTLGAFVHLSLHNTFDDLYVHGIYLLVAILLGVTDGLRRDAC